LNFYEILKTKKLGRGSPDYWTQLFAEHVGGKGEWKVAGVLPLTFTAKGGTAADWVIEENDENGTENLVEGVIEKANISDTGIIVSNTSFNMYVAKIVAGREYTITTSASSGFVYGLFSALPTINSQSYDNNRVIGQRTFTAPIDGKLKGYTLYQGSIAYDIGAGKFYVMDSEGTWHDSEDGSEVSPS
jgi:hypothetical protein